MQKLRLKIEPIWVSIGLDHMCSLQDMKIFEISYICQSSIAEKEWQRRWG